MAKIDFSTLPDQGPDAKIDFSSLPDNADKRSIPEKVSSFVKNAVSLPLLIPKTQFTSGAKVLDAGIEADKRYPAENLLPAIGGSVGAMATAPIPFASTVGAGVGAMGGEYAKQIVSGIRGNPTVSNAGESTSSALKEGGKMAAAELGTSTLLKGLEAIGAGKLARLGYDKFKNGVTDLFSPTEKYSAEAIKEMRNKFMDAPAADTGEVAKYIKDDILGKRGVNILPKIQDSEGATPVQLENLKAAGATPEDIAAFENRGKGFESAVGKLANQNKPIVKASIQSPAISDYKELATVYSNLNQPNLTYDQLKQIQNQVDDLADFHKSEEGRNTFEKIYGKLHGKISELLTKTADENGFLEQHQLLQDEGRKYYARRFLDDVFQKARDVSNPKEPIDWGDVANTLNKYTDEQLKRKFGDNAETIKAFRNLSGVYAKTFPSGGPINGSVNQNLVPFLRLKLGSIRGRFNVPENVDTILSRHLGLEPNSPTGELLFPRFQTERKIIKSGAKGFLPIIQNENQ